MTTEPNAAALWERVAADGTERLAVPGGWLYRTQKGCNSNVALCFVPAPPPINVLPVQPIPHDYAPGNTPWKQPYEVTS